MDLQVLQIIGPSGVGLINHFDGDGELQALQTTSCVVSTLFCPLVQSITDVRLLACTMNNINLKFVYSLFLK